MDTDCAVGLLCCCTAVLLGCRYTLQGLFHPARKVREVYWKIYNTLCIGAQDAILPAFPNVPDDEKNKYCTPEWSSTTSCDGRVRLVPASFGTQCTLVGTQCTLVGTHCTLVGTQCTLVGTQCTLVGSGLFGRALGSASGLTLGQSCWFDQPEASGLVWACAAVRFTIALLIYTWYTDAHVWNRRPCFAQVPMLGTGARCRVPKEYKNIRGH